MNIELLTDEGLISAVELPTAVRAYYIVLDEKLTEDTELTFTYGDSDIFPEEILVYNDDYFQATYEDKHYYTVDHTLIKKLTTDTAPTPTPTPELPSCDSQVGYEYNVGATGSAISFTLSRTDGTGSSETDPELTLIRGGKYTFHINYTSGHSFYICNPVPSSSEQPIYEVYGEGLLNATSGQSLEFTVPHDAVGVWRYSNEIDGVSDMGNIINIVGAPIPCGLEGTGFLVSSSNQNSTLTAFEGLYELSPSDGANVYAKGEGLDRYYLAWDLMASMYGGTKEWMFYDHQKIPLSGSTTRVYSGPCFSADEGWFPDYDAVWYSTEGVPRPDEMLGCTEPPHLSWSVTYTEGDLFLDDQKAQIEMALDRWSEVILEDRTISLEIGYATSDGYWNMVGQGEPWVLDQTRFLTTEAFIGFDPLDLTHPSGGRIAETLVEGDKTELYYVALHEIGHALGIGSLWNAPMSWMDGYGSPHPDIVNARKLIFDSNTDEMLDIHNAEFEIEGEWVNPVYRGTHGIAAYNEITGLNVIELPIEEDGGPGSAVKHIEEDRQGRWAGNVVLPGLEHELMTYALDFGVPNSLSILTVGMLRDLGWNVDMSAADEYTLPEYSGPPPTPDLTEEPPPPEPFHSTISGWEIVVAPQHYAFNSPTWPDVTEGSWYSHLDGCIMTGFYPGPQDSDGIPNSLFGPNPDGYYLKYAPRTMHSQSHVWRDILEDMTGMGPGCDCVRAEHEWIVYHPDHPLCENYSDCGDQWPNGQYCCCPSKLTALQCGGPCDSPESGWNYPCNSGVTVWEDRGNPPSEVDVIWHQGEDNVSKPEPMECEFSWPTPSPTPTPTPFPTNQYSGVCVSSIDLPENPNSQGTFDFRAITIDDTGQYLYVGRAPYQNYGGVYKVELATGQSTLVVQGNAQNNLGPVRSLTYVGGNLYGAIDYRNPDNYGFLVKIDPDTGDITNLPYGDLPESTGMWPTAPFNNMKYIRGIAVDSAQEYLYASDYTSSRLIKTNIATGVSEVFAGKNCTSGCSEADGVGQLAEFKELYGLTIDEENDCLYACTRYTIRKVSLSDATVTTIAGTGSWGWVDGDSGATSKFAYPEQAVLDDSGDYLIVSEVGQNVIRKVNIETGATTTLAGRAYDDGGCNGSNCPSADGPAFPPTNVLFAHPHSIVNAGGGVFYTVQHFPGWPEEQQTGTLRKIELDGTCCCIW